MTNVIIPLYKSHKTLPKLLDSLVAQTKPMFMVTLVNDSDGLDYTEIVNEYKRRGLHISYIVTPENGGPGNARQFGIDNNKMCEFLVFADADDMFMPRAIEQLSREISINNFDVVSSSFLREEAHGPGNVMQVRETPCTWMHGKIYRASYLKNNGIRFLPELRLNEDSYFNLVAINCAKNKGGIDEVTYIWRDNSESITRGMGLTKFFIDTWFMYIHSQIAGLKKIGEICGEVKPELAALTFINIYRHFCEATFRKLNLEIVKDELLELGQNKIVMASVDNGIFWSVLYQNLKGAIVTSDGAFVFPKTNFCDWLAKWVKGE